MIVWERMQTACERLWAAEDAYDRVRGCSERAMRDRLRELREAQAEVLRVARELRPSWRKAGA